MNDNLKMLLIAVVLLVVGFIAVIWQNRTCEQVEYQDLTGTQAVLVCGKL